MAEMRQGLAIWRVAGAGWGQQYFLTLLAEMHGKMGQVEEGLSVLAEALTLMDKTEERWYEAELYRIRGKLLLAQKGRSLT